ncbi:GAF and ANTAR domain-containing protein [Terrabacter sp. NPDC080008]|uniref:GAF and ANTAR domain-containing protein n=1 Tax=Terrabacter sp. NPDC080008 TaxID=3155176 RepID=UPI00344C3B0E
MTGVIDHPSSPEEFAHLARELVETPGVMPTVHGVVESAIHAVPCTWAAVVVTDDVHQRPARMLAANDSELVRVIGGIAVGVGASPGIVAFDEARTVCCPDLEHEEQFRHYAEEMVAHTRVRAVISIPLVLRGATTGVMTVYADRPHAFDRDAAARAHVLAEHAAIAIDAARVEDAAENLEVALLRSRTIGAAMGILIERHKLTVDEAFDRLRVASQNANRKLADIAAELVETGTADGL